LLGRLGEEGQAVIEFCLTIIMLFAFVLFFIQLTLMMAFGNYAHYATFMAARAYLSSGPDDQDQADRARQVIVQMLKKSQAAAGVDKWAFIAKGVGGGDPGGFQLDASQTDDSNPDFSWLHGVRYKFKSRLMMIPLAGRPDGSANSVTLQSESWLGKEPSYSKCQADLQSHSSGIFDNGC
jgi:hypothetical protein